MQPLHANSDRIFTWKIQNLDTESEKGPIVFKEEITVDEYPLDKGDNLVGELSLDAKLDRLKRQGTASSEEYIPEITDVEYEKFLVPRSQSPDLMKPDIVADIESHILTKPDQKPHDIEVSVNVDDQIKEPPEAEEEYFKIPRHYGDMTVRTEDEVSELPDSEIASLVSDRKVELERRDSDVTLSDREYSDKEDENVIISDVESDLEQKPEEKDKPVFGEKPKAFIGESDFDLTLGTPTPVSTDFTLDSEKQERPVVPRLELGVSDQTESETSEESSDKSRTSTDKSSESEKSDKEEKPAIEPGTEPGEESYDESESLGAIPAKVYGDTYMQEISKLMDKPFKDEVQYQVEASELPEDREGKPSEIEPVESFLPKVTTKPVRTVVKSESEESESEESDSEKSETDKPKRPKHYILDYGDDDAYREKMKDIPEFYQARRDKVEPPEGDYPYGTGSPKPKFKSYRKRESSESESDVPQETDESNFEMTTDLETTVDLETTGDLLEDADATPVGVVESSDVDKTTDEESSTVKEEFITLVDTLERPAQQTIEVKDYVSSSDDDVPKALGQRLGDRSESPVIMTTFADELELSRITEEAESEETSETESTASAESVRHVEIPTRDEILHQIPEESESAEVSMELAAGNLSDTSFDVDESYNIEGPLAKSTMGMDEHVPRQVIVRSWRDGTKQGKLFER